MGSASRMARPRLLRGVTLIELMVALAVVAILAAMAGPSFVDSLTKSRLRAAAEEVASLIARARGESIRLDRNVAVALAGSGNAWCVGAISAADPTVGSLVSDTVTACDCSTGAASCLVGGQRLVVSGSDFSGVRLVTGGVLSETFDRRLGSLADLTGSTVTLQAGGSSNDRFQVSVVVNSLGQTRLCLPTGKPNVGGGLSSC